MAATTRAPDPGDRVRAEILEAIRLEHEATREHQRSRSSWHVIGSGHQAALDTSGRVYTFRPGRVLPLRREQVVELAIGDARTCARVLDPGKEELVLACFERLGDPTPPARVRWDASWLLEQLYAAIRDLDFRRRHARLLFHPGEAQQGDPDACLARSASAVVAGLNEGQARAVGRLLGTELGFLWGPPGCGKTTTLAALAEVLYDARRSVLVLGPTNRAVDHLVMAVADRLSAGGNLAPGDVLRVGPISSGALERTHGLLVDPQRAAERFVGDALAEPGEPEQQLAAVAELLSRLGPGPVTGEAAAEAEDPGDAELRRILTEDSRALKEKVRLRQRLVARVRRRLLARARVIGTTLHRALLPGQLERTFDTVIVDEASAAAFPLVLAATAWAERGVVIGGDFRQLPPVVHSRSRKARTWMGRSAFEVAGLPAVVDAGRALPSLHRLTVQYRMRPEISEFVGGIFYNGALRTPDAVRGRRVSDQLPLHQAPLIHVDTANLVAPLRSDRTNHWHAFVVERLLEQVCTKDSSGISPTLDVAVLTPYRRQAGYLRNQLGKKYGAHFGTVHTSQGQEYDIVILDLPEKGDVPPTGFMRATRIDEVGARLLNVALSRARQQVIVIADRAYFDRRTPENGIYRAVLRELRTVPIWKISPKLGRKPHGDDE